MQKMTLYSDAPAATARSQYSQPTVPLTRPVLNEKKFSDPSSTPRVERYPTPSFFEYRIKARDFDPL